MRWGRTTKRFQSISSSLPCHALAGPCWLAGFALVNLEFLSCSKLCSPLSYSWAGLFACLLWGQALGSPCFTAALLLAFLELEVVIFLFCARCCMVCRTAGSGAPALVLLPGSMHRGPLAPSFVGLQIKQESHKSKLQPGRVGKRKEWVKVSTAL